MIYPKYVKIKGLDGSLGCGLRYEGRKNYWRDGGAWGIHTKIVDGKILISSKRTQHLEHLHGMELVEVTQDEWGKDNRGYTGIAKYDEGCHGW